MVYDMLLPSIPVLLATYYLYYLQKGVTKKITLCEYLELYITSSIHGICIGRFCASNFIGYGDHRANKSATTLLAH